MPVGTSLNLKPNEKLYTHNENRSYILQSGRVNVFLAKWDIYRSCALELLPLTELDADRSGTVIPALCFKADHQDWRLCIHALQRSVLTEREGPAGAGEKESFLQLAHVTGYEDEGCEGALVERFTRESLKKRTLVLATEDREKDLSRMITGAIADLFRVKNDELRSADISSDSELYNALSCLCALSRIPMAAYDRVEACCGESFGPEDVAELSGFLCRRVVLQADWYKSDCGPLLSKLEGRWVSCTPAPDRGGRYVLFADGEPKLLTPELAMQISPEAYSIGRALPPESRSLRDILRFGWESINRSDLWLGGAVLLASSLVGLLLPMLNQKIYDDYIPMGEVGQMLQLCTLIGTFMLGRITFDVVKRLSDFRVAGRVAYSLQSATYARVLRLPQSVLQSYDSTDLTQRVMSVEEMARTGCNFLTGTAAGFLFSLLYLFRMFKSDAKLSWIGIAMVLLFALLKYLFERSTLKLETRIAEENAEADSLLKQFLAGIDKLRMAGAENRAMYRYVTPVVRRETLELKKNRVQAPAAAMSAAAVTVFSMVFYKIIVKKQLALSLGSFMAFNAAFGSFAAAALELVDGLMGLLRLRPAYERVKAVYETAEESSEGEELPGRLCGRITLDNVSFAYGKGGNKVIRNLSLEIGAGEYVAIVGASGCGKSTLIKLLLGFEKPDEGRILYDGRDLATLDKRMLRKSMGVVLQSGGLIAGSIQENITITAPKSTLREVNEVVRAVGLEEDVKAMPMGIQTILNESSGNISGGQKQRILIARALIGKPGILLLDEATSALDNITQSKVAATLDSLSATRIVIAHRLSTVVNCDRIIVLDKGTVAEEGSYTELMKKRGLFYELASRQLNEDEDMEERKPVRTKPDSMTTVLSDDRGEIMRMSLQVEGKTITVALSGKLLSSTTVELSTEFNAYMAHGYSIRLDMAGVQSISGRVCRVLLETHEKMPPSQKLVLCNVPEAIRRDMKELGLTQLRIE